MRNMLGLIAFALMVSLTLSVSAAAPPEALNNSFYNVIAPGFDGTNGPQSFVRLANNGGATTTFTVTVVGSPSGQVYGSGQIQVASKASTQFPLSTLVAAAHAGPLVNGDTSYALYMQDSDALLSFQHAVYNATNGDFYNASLCHFDSATDYTALNSFLTNVHTSAFAAYPSQIYVHNYGTSAATYDVTIYDATTGSKIGTVPLLIAANATYSAPFTWYQQQLNWSPTSNQPYANMAFSPQSPATFQIEVGDYIFNQRTSTYVNMTQRCGFIPSSTAKSAYSGTVAGPEAQSGTLSVAVQASVAVAAASPLAKAQSALAKSQSAVEKAQSLASAAATLYLSGGGGIVTATGTYDPATHAITLAGGGYTFTGTVSGGIYSGAYTGPSGVSGAFSSIAGTHDTVTAYCGTYDEPRPPGESSPRAGGVYNIQVAANGTISGDTSSTYGQGYHHGVFTGHAEGSLAYLTHSSSNGDPANTDDVMGSRLRHR